MADRIKGITIEFKGNATPLQKAIREVDSALSKTTKELSSVNKALKFNPTSVELWRQKQDLLTQKILGIYVCAQFCLTFCDPMECVC